MTVRNRIATIRLSEKLDRNPKYAEYIGVYVVNREADTQEIKEYENRDNKYLKVKDREEYEYKSRTVSS